MLPDPLFSLPNLRILNVDENQLTKVRERFEAASALRLPTEMTLGRCGVGSAQAA